MPPEYPRFPTGLIVEIAWSLLRHNRRSFRQDALRCTRRLKMKVTGQEHIPTCGPGVVLVNHYSRPGFFALWIPLAVSAAVPHELVWVMTAAWTNTGTPWSRLKEVVSLQLFPRLARLYGYIAMPPMPPRPHEAPARSQAVRRLLSAARQQPPPLIAISPEGQDTPGGALMRPHPGVGRMLARLAELGNAFYPLGVYESTDSLVLDFGPPFTLCLPQGLNPDEVDRQAADLAMQAVAARLPECLRGAYASKSRSQPKP